MKLSKEERQAMADRFAIDVRSYIINTRSWLRVEYRGDERQEKMRSYQRADFAPLRRIVSLFRRGKDEEAYRLAWELDTLPREHIPGPVWDVLCEAALCARPAYPKVP